MALELSVVILAQGVSDEQVSLLLQSINYQNSSVSDIEVCLLCFPQQLEVFKAFKTRFQLTCIPIGADNSLKGQLTALSTHTLAPYCFFLNSAYFPHRNTLKTLREAFKEKKDDYTVFVAQKEVLPANANTYLAKAIEHTSLYSFPTPSSHAYTRFSLVASCMPSWLLTFLIEKTPPHTLLSKGVDHWLGFCLDQIGCHFSPIKGFVYLTAPLNISAVLTTIQSEAKQLLFYSKNHPIFLQAILGRSGIPWRSPQRLKDWLAQTHPQQLETALTRNALRDIGEPFLRHQGDASSTHFIAFIKNLLNYEKYYQIQSLLAIPSFSNMVLFPALHKRLSSSGVDLIPEHEHSIAPILYEKHYEKADMILDLLSRTAWKTGLEVAEKPDLKTTLNTEKSIIECSISPTDHQQLATQIAELQSTQPFKNVDWMFIDIEKSELQCWISFHESLEPLLALGGQLFLCSNSPRLLESFFGRLIRNYPYLVAGDYQGNHLKVAIKTSNYQAPEKSRPFL